MSNFKEDLAKEKFLSEYLNSIYKKTLKINFDRVTNLNLQHKGVDLIYHARDKDYFIDEKAQLNYIDCSLPTFTFELSYFKDEVEKCGWLIDKTKITTHYFLITGIYANDKNDLSKGFKKCSITSVDKLKLKGYLTSIGLDDEKLLQYQKDVRLKKKPLTKTRLKELDMIKEGCLFYSPQLTEKPINLQLRLKFLTEKGIAKRLI